LLFNFDPTLSSVEQGRRKTQWVVLVTLVTVVLVLLVGGAGIYINNIRQPSTPVAVVNGEPIRRDTWQHYQALVIAELQGQAQQLQANQPAPNDAAATANQQAALNALQQQLSSVGDQAANDLINAQIVADAIPALEKSGAPTAQIVPTTRQVDAALIQEQKQLGAPTASQYQQVLAATGLNDAQVRGILTTRLEETNIKAYLSRDLKTVQPQVKARIMSFGDAAKAAAALKELQSGGHWADVNAQYQKDTAAKEISRAVDWTPKGVEDATFDQFAFGAQPFLDLPGPGRQRQFGDHSGYGCGAGPAFEPEPDRSDQGQDLHGLAEQRDQQRPGATLSAEHGTISMTIVVASLLAATTRPMPIGSIGHKPGGSDQQL